METIFNIYQIVDKHPEELPTYCILFGNREEGWCMEKDELIHFWNKAIRCSKSIHYGDVTLFKNGKLIRAVHNARERILNKNITYPCFYNVYDENDNVIRQSKIIE